MLNSFHPLYSRPQPTPTYLSCCIKRPPSSLLQRPLGDPIFFWFSESFRKEQGFRSSYILMTEVKRQIRNIWPHQSRHSAPASLASASPETFPWCVSLVLGALAPNSPWHSLTLECCCTYHYSLRLLSVLLWLAIHLDLVMGRLLTEKPFSGEAWLPCLGKIPLFFPPPPVLRPVPCTLVNHGFSRRLTSPEGWVMLRRLVTLKGGGQIITVVLWGTAAKRVGFGRK
jgi:hypothetical protein